MTKTKKTKKRLFEPFDRDKHLVRIAECEETVKRIGLVHVLCHEIGLAGKGPVSDAERGELYTGLLLAASPDIKPGELFEKRLDLLKAFCAKYGF